MTVQPLDLAGKRILVTGGASGIGDASTALFTGLGARVVIADLDATTLEAAQARNGAVAHTICNVVDEAQVDAMIGVALDTLGGLDGVLNCAGVADAVAAATDQPIETWQRIIDINLRGTYLVCRAAGRHMLAEGTGSIVNLSSVNGTAGWPRRNAYGATKAAVAATTRSLASEWGDRGVRVNALAPAYIATPMVAALIDSGRVDSKRINDRTPLKRFGTPTEVGQAAAFLLSDWAAYITGVVLPVDGGWLAYGGAGDPATF
jgi:NAD(P)-dependent dehydrogenase (short-subunit alcohol dehydrogenase family)